MQTTFIKAGKLKETFQTCFIWVNDDEHLISRQINFKTELFPVLEMKETFKYVSDTHSMTTLEDLEAIKNNYKHYIESLINDYLYKIEQKIKLYKSNYIERFKAYLKKDDTLLNLQMEYDKYSAYVLNLDEKPMINDAIIETIDNESLVRVPFYQLEQNSIVYEVSTASVGSLKITPYKVAAIYITNNTDTATQCDYEFEYMLVPLSGHLVTNFLNYASMRTFDGKSMKNGLYENFIFVDKEAAKNHVKKVIESLKSSLDEQIKIIDSL